MPPVPRGRPHLPASVRISATDWVAGGVEGDESVAIARAFHEAGADIIHVSTGQTSPDATPAPPVRPHVPDALQRSHSATRPGSPDHRRRQHRRRRSGERHHRRRTGRSLRARPAAPHRSLLDAARRRRARVSPQRRAPKSYLTGRSQLERELARRNPTRNPPAESGII